MLTSFGAVENVKRPGRAYPGLVTKLVASDLIATQDEIATVAPFPA